MEMKLVILVRQDLKLPKGKLAAQAAHAAVEATLRAGKTKVSAWRSQGQKKVVLKVADEKELLRFLQLAKDEGFNTALITDAGRTCIAPGTKTCIGIGPDSEENIDKLTGNLPMM
ncbi:peptidyl-tRNA hydrolase Pth2 [Candidatus Woesearchaeota archaeon]|nr:peptidyl-tRNA hydrolase Pth2 [Candidatus Woesearchaeota archaeon]